MIILSETLKASSVGKTTATEQHVSSSISLNDKNISIGEIVKQLT